MARYLKSPLYIHLLPHTIIQLSPFIDLLKITLKVMLKRRSNHFIVQSLKQHPLKASAGKSNARMYNIFISQEKERKKNQKNVRKTYYWKLIFVICGYSTWSCERVGAGQGSAGALWRVGAEAWGCVDASARWLVGSPQAFRFFGVVRRGCCIG